MERWYWIELIGFDNEVSDLGVGNFLSRNVSTTGVSLLFSHIDILFDKKNELLPPTACSYGGHEYNRERRRQQWTKTQLKALVRELHRHGVKVFFSCFDMTENITDPDMLCYNKRGAPSRCVYVLKQSRDVSVGDLVIDGIRDILDEYDFDGLQLADGLSSNRRSIENGDFSLQLCEASQIDIPEHLMKNGKRAYADRRRWILKNARYEWTEFIAKGWESFYTRLFDRVKKPIMFNNAWTRDHFEAFYRYGLDYSKCQLDRAFAVMVEENSATRSIMSPEDEGGVVLPMESRDGIPYEYALMQQNIKLVTHGKKQISLMPISDTQEQWDALRHCPTELIRSIVKRYNNFVYINGRFQPCCDAPLYCLSDGIPKEDWRWLSVQEGYRLPEPTFIDGFAAVINPDAMKADVKQFCIRKNYYGSALLNELIAGGLNLSAELSISDTQAFDKAKGLVVTDLNAYTEAQKHLLREVKLPLLVIGEDVELPMMEKRGYYKGEYLSVALYGHGKKLDLSSLASLERRTSPKRAQQGEIWTEPLSFARVHPAFFKKLCNILNDAFELDYTEESVKVNSFICGKEKYLLLSNDRHTYCLPTVNTNVSISEADALMKGAGYEIKIKGKSLRVRIPPRCVEIVKITVD